MNKSFLYFTLTSLTCTLSLLPVKTGPEKQQEIPLALHQLQPTAPKLYQEIPLKTETIGQVAEVITLSIPSDPTSEPMCCEKMCGCLATCLNACSDCTRRCRNDCTKGCNLFKDTQIYKKVSQFFKNSSCKQVPEKKCCSECPPDACVCSDSKLNSSCTDSILVGSACICCPCATTVLCIAASACMPCAVCLAGVIVFILGSARPILG